MINTKYIPTELMHTTSHYDQKKADRAVNFIEQLAHTKGRWYGRPFKLMGWQEKIVRDIFGTIKENGYRQFNTAYVEIPKKNGKQLDVNTLIPTPTGFTKMGVLKVGDLVFDEEGKTCQVVAKSQVDDKEQAYKIMFANGEYIIAGKRHLWKINEINNIKFNKVISTYEMYKRFLKGEILKIYNYINSSNFEIEHIEAVNHKVKMQCIQVDSKSHLYLCGKSMIPTHNSELAAAVALYLLCADHEQRAEIYGAAADRQQASIVFDVAADMVRLNSDLSQRCKILTANKRILYLPTNSFYQVLSAEAYSKQGFNIHGVVFDEFFAQPNRKLYDVLTKGSGDARLQPLFFLITTAGDNVNSICYEIHQKAKDILEGRKIDHTFYPVIYGADESDSWISEDVWMKANPSLGETITIDKVRDAFNSAKQNPAEENTFRQLRLNQWVKQSVRWMPMLKWDKCAFPVDRESLKGRVCYGGLDLSSTTDISAFVLVFPPLDEDDKYQVLPFFWIPDENVSLRVNRDHVPYDVWKAKGYLETTEGNVIHYDFIEKFIDDLGKIYNIKNICFDRWGAVQMSQNLEGLGFEVVPFGQGFKDMSPATKELMNLVLDEKIAHGGNPVLRWMMDNIFVRQDPAGNIKPDKEKSTERIDGAVALIMALDRAIRCKGDNNGSVYDKRGILVL